MNHLLRNMKMFHSDEQPVSYIFFKVHNQLDTGIRLYCFHLVAIHKYFHSTIYWFVVIKSVNRNCGKTFSQIWKKNSYRREIINLIKPKLMLYFLIREISSVWQSTCSTSKGSQVQILYLPQLNFLLLHQKQFQSKIFIWRKY